MADSGLNAAAGGFAGGARQAAMMFLKSDVGFFSETVGIGPQGVQETLDFPADLRVSRNLPLSRSNWSC